MYISGMYIILCLLSLRALYYLIRIVANKRASYYVVLFTLISVVCLAYFAYSFSDSADMALVANQFSYLDSTFILTFFLFCVLDICGIKVSKWLNNILTTLCIIILGIVFSISKVPYFYKTYNLVRYAGASRLLIEFGPLHKYFLVFVVLLTLAPMCVIVYSFFYKKKISYKYTTALGGLEIAILSIYFIQFYSGAQFDLLPCGYVLMEYVILGVMQRITLYDMSQIILDSSEERRELGYIIFDKNRAYVGSNSVARYYFPEIEAFEIDRQVEDEFIKKEFIDRIEYVLSGGRLDKTFEREGRILVCDIKPYIYGKNDKISGYIVEIKDDTDQQLMIQTLNKMNVDLAEAVQEANKASQAKSEFLANMSHEIRTPINAILGMNEIALRDCEQQELVPYLNEIRNAGNNLLFIINDILDFSKIEAGKIELIDGEYNIGSLVRDVERLIVVKAREKDLEFGVEVESALPSELRGDENRIRQVIINILNNAVKYTHSGSVKMTVSQKQKKGAVVSLQIAVKDTGIGIKKESIDSLFDSFSRVDEKKNKNIEGTGLGLAITKQLVDMMGGEIKVESEYGVGTTFTIIIPQEIIDDTPVGEFDTAYDADIMEKKVEEHIDASEVDILVVDDNAVNLAVVKGLLKPTNARTVLCKSGAECLKLIEQKHFDIILLDHMMPEMDGIETLKMSRRLENNMCRNSRYIALTANALSGMREMYINEGFDDYISKPIDSKLLESMIEKYSKTSAQL